MVAPDRTPLQVVTEDDSSKRRQILDGASKVFMNLGFDGASMGEIARAAGVSKGTLYVYFADKNRLFEAIVEREMLDQQKIAFNFDPERDVTVTLREFGQAYIELLCRPGGGSAIRTVMAIAERMPEVGRRYYENVLEQTIDRLASYLQARVRAKRRQPPASPPPAFRQSDQPASRQVGARRSPPKPSEPARPGRRRIPAPARFE